MPTLPKKNRQNVQCFRQSGVRQNGIRQKRHIPIRPKQLDQRRTLHSRVVSMNPAILSAPRSVSSGKTEMARRSFSFTPSTSKQAKTPTKCSLCCDHPSTLKPKLLGRALVIFFSISKETRSIYFYRVFSHIGSNLVFFRTNGLTSKLYSRFSKITHSNQRKKFAAFLFTLGYGNTACFLVFDFLYSSSQESL